AAGLQDASAQHDQLRIEEVDERPHRNSEVAAGRLQDGGRELVSGARGPHHILGTRVRETVQGAARGVRRGDPGGMGDPRATGHRFNTPMIAAAAQRSARLHDDMTDLPGNPVRASIELAPQDETGANAGGNRHIDELAGTAGRAATVLAKRCQMRIVVKEAGNSGRSGEDPVERDVVEAPPPPPPHHPPAPPLHRPPHTPPHRAPPSPPPPPPPPPPTHPP